MSRGRSSRSFASRDMIRYSCSATWRTLARAVAVAPGGVTRKRIRPRSVVATRWNAGQSCQPSPSPSGSSSITQEPASRWRRCTIPIRSISAAMMSSRFAPTDCCGVAASSSRSEIPGRPVPLSLPSRPNRSIREAGGSRQRMPGWCRKTDSCTNGTTVRTSGMRWPVSCAQRISSSWSLLASRCALRRASLSGESSCPVAVAPPGQVVPAQGARVVLQLH